MLNDWNFWFSVVTAIVAIIALMQTSQHIKLSNKQHLFDKRIENYLIATGLIQLYRSNCMNFNNEKDEPIFAVDLEFTWLTNNIYLEPITSAIENPLKEPSHKELLIKLENLKDVDAKIKFLFSGKASLEESQQRVREKQHRIKLQEAFDNLKQADSMLKKENAEEQIKKQIKLC